MFQRFIPGLVLALCFTLSCHLAVGGTDGPRNRFTACASMVTERYLNAKPGEHLEFLKKRPLFLPYAALLSHFRGWINYSGGYTMSGGGSPNEHHNDSASYIVGPWEVSLTISDAFRSNSLLVGVELLTDGYDSPEAPAAREMLQVILDEAHAQLGLNPNSTVVLGKTLECGKSAPVDPAVSYGPCLREWIDSSWSLSAPNPFYLIPLPPRYLEVQMKFIEILLSRLQ